MYKQSLNELASEGERLCKSNDCANGIKYFEAALDGTMLSAEAHYRLGLLALVDGTILRDFVQFLPDVIFGLVLLLFSQELLEVWAIAFLVLLNALYF